MKNILVPIDFSKTSLNAVNYAVAFAGAVDASLHIVNVIPPPILVDDLVLASVLITQTELMENHKQLMKEKIESLSKISGKNINGLVVEGPPSDIICEIAGKKKLISL